MDDLARRIAENVAREAYGRLLAYLAVRERNVAAAEDALAEAFAQALAHWPATGVPERPEAWLLTVARRGLLHGYRHAGVQRAARAQLDLAIEEAEAMARSDRPTIPDERLALFFVCAHPAIDPSARAPLMLQTVLGIDAATISRAFLVGSATLGQRLVRAKRKIAAAGIAFRVPDREALAERLEPVLDGIYATYGTGWAMTDGGPEGLAGEAIWLGRVLASLLPDEPEALGLLALMLYAESRREARFGPDGAYIPLSEQDVGLWDGDVIDEADRLLRVTGRLKGFGRFRCEAAIQAVHAARRTTGVTDCRRSASCTTRSCGSLRPSAGRSAGRLSWPRPRARQRGSRRWPASRPRTSRRTSPTGRCAPTSCVARVTWRWRANLTTGRLC